MAVRIVYLGLFREAVIVDIGADLGAHATEADDALDQLFNGTADTVLECQTHLFGALSGKSAILVIGAPGQKLAAAVEDGNVLRFHVGNGCGDQMLDCQNLLAAEAAGTLNLQHHGCAWLAPLAAEEFALRQHQMDAGAADIVHRPDGPSEFAFKRADQVDVLNEIGCAETV